MEAPGDQGDAFVALRGSWNRTPPVDYKVIRIRFEGGRPVAAEDFLVGFQVDPRRTPLAHLIPGGSYQFARLAGIAVAAEARALLVADDSNGVIYGVSRRSTGRGTTAGLRD